ncbi:PREDICTED: leucine-rich repeat-containing protein 4C-like [Priapulus caudatus]|uniref:Leucine-rich repeat-containing protein 4C-like n=1 Tax=Priapulus caudatus TaxID=37621 RepID=A0ABM1EN23_PRICU|nr:PREDICTED: leucine-rich repeat-containing protein 4C-like [Priapulus caudatus]XP_014673595.1 PREDICTED: leucine-rich repeat-containing protein 4C-like [Priapulus caudatus]
MCKLVILLVAAVVIAVTHAHPHPDPPCPSLHVLGECTCTSPYNGYPNIVCDGHDMSSSHAFSVMAALPRDVTYASIELHGFYDMEEVPEHVFDGLHFEHGSLTIDDSHHHGVAPVLHAHSFEEMYHLEELTLSYLKLTAVPTIIGPTIIDHILKFSLKGNDITNMGPNDCHAHYVVVKVNMAENNLEYIDPKALCGMINLKVLDLTSAAVLYLQPGTLGEAENLETLELAGNGLVSLQPGVFAGLHHVEHLDFTGSSLTWISPGAFDDTEGILTVDMPSQHLYYIAEDAFRGLTDIEYIDLSGNHLTTLARNVFDDHLFDHHHHHHYHHHHHNDHDDHVHIDLTGNPLICGCDIAWLTVHPFYPEGTCTNGNNAISLSHLHLACP